ncbi:MAG: hypothetical protein K9G76_03650 [Bacteroidales bacterium]|nr:hypothetical protein [Bacteroidales bacterium]MCF8402889.1 hypothetical protein [Bacteroidales bacterium]
MEDNKKPGMSLLTKISIAANILLFGITGVIYLIEGNNIIGYILLAAGALNIIYLLFTLKTKNVFFVILNFLFAAVSLIVCFDYFIGNDSNTTIGLIWMVITLIYLVVGFILLLQVRKKSQNKPETTPEETT